MSTAQKVPGLVDILASQKPKKGFDQTHGLPLEEFFKAFDVSSYCTWPCAECAFEKICGVE